MLKDSSGYKIFNKYCQSIYTEFGDYNTTALLDFHMVEVLDSRAGGNPSERI